MNELTETARRLGPTPASLAAAVLRGSWGFTVVSLAAFSIWAFAGRWFYRHVGEAGL